MVNLMLCEFHSSLNLKRKRHTDLRYSDGNALENRKYPMSTNEGLVKSV